MSLDFAIIYLASRCVCPLLQVPLCWQASFFFFLKTSDMLLCLIFLKPMHGFLTVFCLMVFYMSTGATRLYNAFLVGYGKLMIQSIIYFECFWSFLLFYRYYNISATSMMTIVQYLFWSVIKYISRCLYMVIESICTYKSPQFAKTTRGCSNICSVIYFHSTITVHLFNLSIIGC